ncbi:hypothetical protein [Zhongshania sp.]|uniref:hypothetical protein n=1 Tax=Zhongshania sp. TaxID=1971902 RepID=UPI0035697EA7
MCRKFGLLLFMMSMCANLLCAQTRDVRSLPEYNPFLWPEIAAEQMGAKASVTSTELPTVRAIMVAGSYRAANVDGQLLQAGAVVNGYTILSISEQGVIFGKGGVEYSAAVYRGDEK